MLFISYSLKFVVGNWQYMEYLASQLQQLILFTFTYLHTLLMNVPVAW